MQLRHARRLSKTRSVRLGKWPKCSQCSGSHGACVRVCGIARGGSTRRPYEVSVSSVTRVQRSFLTCLSIGVFPAERRAKMCWRLRAWRPLACCRAEYSLEADRHCRAVSTRHSSSLDFYSILFGWGLHHRVSPACQPPLHSSTSECNSDQHRTVGFVFDVCSYFVYYGWNITDVKLNIQAWSDGFPPTYSLLVYTQPVALPISPSVLVSFYGSGICVIAHSLRTNACRTPLSFGCVAGEHVCLIPGPTRAAESLEGGCILHLHGFIRSNLLPSSSPLSHHWSHWSTRAAWWGQRR